MKLAALICSADLENMQNIFFITLLIFIKSEIEINITVQSLHTCESGGKELSIGIRILLGILVNHYWYIHKSVPKCRKKDLKTLFQNEGKGNLCVAIIAVFKLCIFRASAARGAQGASALINF